MSHQPFPTTWDLTPFLDSDTDPRIPQFEAELEKAATTFATTWKDRNDYLEDVHVLLEALTHYEKVMADFGTDGPMGYYFFLRSSQDANDTVVKAGGNRIDELSAKLHNAISFFELRLSAQPAEKLAAFATNTTLAKFKHFLEMLSANAPHNLTEAEEKILTTKAPLLHDNWEQLRERLFSSETAPVQGEEKSLEELMTLVSDEDKVVRDEAFAGINGIIKKHLIVAETEINAVLSNKKSNDELRKFARPDSSRHLGDDMETEVVDGMLNAVEKRFDIASRFYTLKAKLLGVEKLAYHERNLEYGVLITKYPYEDAVALVSETLHELDPLFSTHLMDFVTTGAVDVYPKKGKRGGAFCMYHHISQPVYIMLNHTDKLNDVLTLAHEAGHGINNQFMREKQNSLSFATPMATAEVASTFMEDFVLDRIASTANDEERLAIMMMKLNSDVSTIFRQVACYRFEQDLHEAFRRESYLDAQAIGKLFRKNMTAYMGPSIELGEGVENWWADWHHIRSFFYVYSYASGLLISKSMQASVKQDPAFIEKVKEFLSAGTSMSPRDIFKNMDIDIASEVFWNEGLGRVESLLNETEALAKKLGKL
jgi:oligoendopeptidase F